MSMRHPVGAAGLLLVGQGCVLVQLRSESVCHPDTWALPGGACEAGESAADTALRETREEVAGLPMGRVRLTGQQHTTDGYTTALARYGGATLPYVWPANRESDDAWWCPIQRVARQDLHPGFRAAWPALQVLITEHTEHEETTA